MSPLNRPHVERATLVVTMSDGSRTSWVMNGDEMTDLKVTTEPEYIERRFIGSYLPDYQSTGYVDLTFKLSKVGPGYTMFHQEAPGEPDEQPAIEKPRDAVESGRDANGSAPAE